MLCYVVWGNVLLPVPDVDAMDGITVNKSKLREKKTCSFHTDFLL